MVLCGRLDADGRHHCDGALAEIIAAPAGGGTSSRRPAPLPGWTMDRKGVWVRTTSVEDRRASGRAPGRLPPERRAFPQLPALVRCPKCRAVQWIDPARLDPAGEASAAVRPGGNRWLRPGPT